MASISIKTIRGRQYRYLQWYEGGSRVPKSKYLGPVNPKRRKGILGQILGGGISIGVHAVTGTLGKPGPVKYKDRPRPPDPRTQVHQHNHFVDMAERDPKAAIRDIQGRARMAAASKPAPAPMNEEMAKFAAHIAEVTAEQHAREAASPEAPATPDAPERGEEG